MFSWCQASQSRRLHVPSLLEIDRPYGWPKKQILVGYAQDSSSLGVSGNKETTMYIVALVATTHLSSRLFNIFHSFGSQINGEILACLCDTSLLCRIHIHISKVS